MTGLEHNPFLSFLGIEIENWTSEHIIMSMILKPMHLNRQGVLQGGVVSALLDATCGYAGLDPCPNNISGNGVTISLAVNFIGSVKNGKIISTGTVIGRGRKIYFAKGEVVTADGRVLASAQGSFKYGSALLK